MRLCTSDTENKEQKEFIGQYIGNPKRISLGYRPTFGPIAVDRIAQGRAIKPRARILGAMARANLFEDHNEET